MASAPTGQTAAQAEHPLHGGGGGDVGAGPRPREFTDGGEGVRQEGPGFPDQRVELGCRGGVIDGVHGGVLPLRKRASAQVQGIQDVLDPHELVDERRIGAAAEHAEILAEVEGQGRAVERIGQDVRRVLDVAEECARPAELVGGAKPLGQGMAAFREDDDVGIQPFGDLADRVVGGDEVFLSEEIAKDVFPAAVGVFLGEGGPFPPVQEEGRIQHATWLDAGRLFDGIAAGALADGHGLEASEPFFVLGAHGFGNPVDGQAGGVRNPPDIVPAEIEEERGCPLEAGGIPDLVASADERVAAGRVIPNLLDGVVENGREGREEIPAEFPAARRVPLEIPLEAFVPCLPEISQDAGMPEGHPEVLEVVVDFVPAGFPFVPEGDPETVVLDDFAPATEIADGGLQGVGLQHGPVVVRVVERHESDFFHAAHSRFRGWTMRASFFQSPRHSLRWKTSPVANTVPAATEPTSKAWSTHWP